ncbi:hypothetical protein WJX84_007258 [Apatococcus fuscideae]
MAPPMILGPDVAELERSFTRLSSRPPELPDSPRSSLATAGDSDDAFRAEDLPEISQAEWTIEIKPGLEDMSLSASDSEDEEEERHHRLAFQARLQAAD